VSRWVTGLRQEDSEHESDDNRRADTKLYDCAIKAFLGLFCSECHGRSHRENVSHGRNDADDEKVLKLENTIGVAGYDGADDLKNDDDEQNVVDGLNHPIGKKWRRGENAHHAVYERSNRNAEEKDSQGNVEDILNALGPLRRDNALV
jgi:hypothetical protein